MKTKILIIAASILMFFACKPKQPEHTIEFQGKFYKEPNPIQYDSNGDGVITEADDEISVLGNSLDVTETPDGKDLYKSTLDTSSSSISNVPSGQKLCYKDLQRYCDQNGGLYAYETSMNASSESIKEISAKQQVDENEDGILDYIQDIRENKIEGLIEKYYKSAASEAETLIEKATGSKISAFVLEEEIKQALYTAFYATIYKNNESVDLDNIQQEISTSVAEAIKSVVEQTGLITALTEEELETISYTVSNKLSTNITDDLGAIVANAVLAQYRELAKSDVIENVQGLCPNGYHIPSDVEWLMFEQALGMDNSDLMKSGETVTDRGANNSVVENMIKNHGFNYGGYVSTNGTYAQLDEAGVFWSSTIGEDAKGTYVWVRQIDTSYTGILRFKLYNMAGLSVRCFKD